MTRSSRCKLLLVLSLTVASCVLVTSPAAAQSPDNVVPVSAEPNHRVRFDNGKVRTYEVRLAKGQATAFHEHSADSFSVILATTTRINEPRDGPRVDGAVKAGQVGFASTDKGPYTHRIEATGETPYRVIAMEILGPGRLGSGMSAAKRPHPFVVASQDNQRGRAYRLNLKPGESTGAFERPANTAIFAISSGRTSEVADGQRPRLWDLETGSFGWSEDAQRLTVRNEGVTDIEIVEIEIF